MKLFRKLTKRASIDESQKNSTSAVDSHSLPELQRLSSSEISQASKEKASTLSIISRPVVPPIISTSQIYQGVTVSEGILLKPSSPKTSRNSLRFKVLNNEKKNSFRERTSSDGADTKSKSSENNNWIEVAPKKRHPKSQSNIVHRYSVQGVPHETAEELIEKLKSEAEFNNSVENSFNEIHTIDQLTTFAAFGISLPTLSPAKRAASQATSFASTQGTSDTRDTIDSTIIIDVAPPLPTSRFKKIGSAKEVLSNISRNDSNSSLVGSQGRTSLLSREQYTPPDLSAAPRRRSILRDCVHGDHVANVVDQKIIVDYGGDVVHYTKESESLMKPSIMSTLAGNSLDQDEVMSEVDKKSLSLEIPLFEQALQVNMTSSVFLEGEFIIRKHDIGHEMYFLSKGQVEILSSDGKTRYGLINTGSFFGLLF